MTADTRARPQLWGGVECSVTRVRDDYIDQLDATSHALRDGDVEKLSEVGFTHVRFPVIWERVAPGAEPGATENWEWCDRNLAVLRAAGITPIIGLLHHGSGPRHTSLVDPAFPRLLARFAAKVAERYPWISHVTPINEPLTTARFSGLYGHWYPHACDPRVFARAFLHEIAGTRQAMEAIRAVAPGAQLVQTEDLGKTYGTVELAYQCAFENERRWLTYDMLCGRVDEQHPLYAYLRSCGLSVRELAEMVERPCPPDIIGVNHYVTSERFLDHRLERYPEHVHGGNGIHRYADVEAVRARREGIAGHAAILRETVERYDRPVALTEVHLGCTREHQLRWLGQAWDAASALRREGLDVRAVTVWSLFGNYGWDELLTKRGGAYEPGAFDVRDGGARRTAVAHMARALGQGGTFSHAAMQGPGWWATDARLCYGDAAPAEDAREEIAPTHAQPLLITGANGTLGRALARICRERELSFIAVDRRTLDIADARRVRWMLEETKPWAVINAAGYVRVDDAEGDRENCFRVNVLGAETLARECARNGIQLATFSSDLVFDGRRREAYRESDRVAPLGVYGASKAAAEAAVMRIFGDALVVRTSAFFGPWDEHNFLTLALRSIGRGAPFPASEDMVVSPTYVPDLIHAVLDMVIDGERGIWHAANAGETSWADFARHAARRAGLDESLVRSRSRRDMGLRAPRPDYSVLVSERANLLPTLESALDRFMRDRPLADLIGELTAVEGRVAALGVGAA